MFFQLLTAAVMGQSVRCSKQRAEFLPCGSVSNVSFPFSSDFDAFLRNIERREHEKSRRHKKSRRRLEDFQASKYIGETERLKVGSKGAEYALAESQRLNIELYESRCASLQRFVALTVMFHQLGRRVQEWFPAHSFGLLGYRMDRTHSIMRVATTASPVSGADVRERMERLQNIHVIEDSVRIISAAWSRYRAKETRRYFQSKNKRKIIIRDDSNTSAGETESPTQSEVEHDVLEQVIQRETVGQGSYATDFDESRVRFL